MNPNQLTATSGSGTQTSTQSPQLSSGANPGGTPTSSVQRGTASDLLRSQTGIRLGASSPLTVDLSGSSSGTVATTASPTPAKHSTNYVLIGIAIICVVAAVVMIWAINRSVKNTTYN